MDDRHPPDPDEPLAEARRHARSIWFLGARPMVAAALAPALDELSEARPSQAKGAC